ncbi:MAG TPA: lactonase family protein [Chloroflexota bacterium]|nr:lactonase family protein [Chloroflexota bacterium]
MPANLVYVGTYTQPSPPRRGEGIYVFRRDPVSGALSDRRVVSSIVNPSFLAFDPAQRFLFAVIETRAYQGTTGGGVASFAIGADGGLTQLSEQPTVGGDPCHLCTDPTGRFLFVANHEDGNVAVFPVGEDGRLGAMTDLVQHHGSGPGPTQKGPHAHFTTLDPTGQRLLVNDKGIDKVMAYRLDAANGKLIPNNPPFGQLHAGAAPRHLAFHPSGRYTYVNGEADMTVTAFRYDPERGAFEEIHYLSTMPAGETADRLSTAQILVEPSGRYVYVSNRGHHSIAIFAIDQATGRLTAVGHQPTGGQTPRNFQIDPEGRYLYAANQDSHSIVVFRIDPATGKLEPTGHQYEVGSPVCILFGT